MKEYKVVKIDFNLSTHDSQLKMLEFDLNNGWVIKRCDHISNRLIYILSKIKT